MNKGRLLMIATMLIAQLAYAEEKPPNFLIVGGPDKMTLNSELTVISQSASGVTGIDKSLEYSANISISGQIKQHGYVFVSLESSQGQLINASSFSPNGDYTGGVFPGFDETRIYEARFDLCFTDLAYITIGKVEVSGYFDKNKFAKNEAKDFLSSALLDNPSIPFPANPTGGINLTIDPTKQIRVRAGLFEAGDQFSGNLDSNFSMIELTYKNKKKNATGNYRVSIWSCDACENVDQTGFGINIDQELGKDLGLFARFGNKSDATVARPFKNSLQAGVQKTIAKHRLGFGLSNLFADTGDDERHMEVFYDFAFVENVHIGVDLQYIQNPFFSASNDDATVFGVRGQVNF